MEADGNGSAGHPALRVLAGADARTRVLVAIALTTAIPLLTLVYVLLNYVFGMPADQRGYLPALMLCTMLLIVSGGIVIWQLAGEAERANRRWRELSLTDELTAVFNRRYLDLRLREEVARAERHAHPLSLVLLDVDHFKEINDLHGHHAGDQVLRELARLIQAHSRATTALCRYGGDEFAILLPETAWSGALVYADRIRTAVREAAFPHGQPVTVSVGVGTFPDDARTVEDLLKAADTSLYAAKAGGRDRVGG
jgi:diguanylate cyclase (GGDEF)-like protein